MYSLVNGSNLHNLLNNCIDKITNTNVSEIIHHIQNKTGYRKIKEKQINQISELDTTLMKLEQESIKEMLSKI